MARQKSAIAEFEICGVSTRRLHTYPEGIQKQFVLDEKSKTWFLPEKTWHEWRAHSPSAGNYVPVKYSLTGSEVSALVQGTSVMDEIPLYEGQEGDPYRSALELWAAKRGENLLSENGNETVFEDGHVAEPFIRAKFVQVFKHDNPDKKVELIEDNFFYQSNKTPFALADIDGTIRVDGEKGILECKKCDTRSKFFPLWKKGIVPFHYYIQVLWYLYVTGRKFAYICCAWGLSSRECVYMRIDRNEDAINALVSVAKSFIDCCETGEKPDVTGQNPVLVAKAYRKMAGAFDFEEEAPVENDAPEMVEAAEKLATILEEIKNAEKQIKNLKKERDKILNSAVFPVAGKANAVKVGDVLIKLKNKPRKTKVDTAHLKEDNPSLYNKYVEQTFNSKAFFEGESWELARQYIDGLNDLSEAKQNYCEVVRPKGA